MSSKLQIDTRVRSLKAYMDDFELGKIQIPSFQRDFLWSQDDIKQLFDSIKNNYPIGSIQFWKPLNNIDSWIDVNDAYIGPYKLINQEAVPSDIVYILDGVQRLSSLFGCLTNPETYNTGNLELNKKKWEEKFNLYYDLDEERFIYLRRRARNKAYQVPVYLFMKTIDFRKYSRQNFSEIDEDVVEVYLDRADALGQTLLNYQIALVDVEYASIEEAVEIFWRVNAKGLEISKDWIVSALTLNTDFRLGSEIDLLLDELKPYSYHNIKRDIIFQCIQNCFGKIYLDYDIEDLIRRDDFSLVAKKSVFAIKRAVKFLYEELLVLNKSLIPYNTQLIFFTAFFYVLDGKEPTKEQCLQLKKWFWFTTYSNYFTICTLSGHRKAYEQFMAFADDETVNPVYSDMTENQSFSTLPFPEKIYMGSVRSKALTIFMVNYALKKEYIIAVNSNRNVEYFEQGKLFKRPQKDNPAENFVPIIIMNTNDGSKSTLDKKNSYCFSQIITPPLEEHFINNEMESKYKKGIKGENYILQLRKQLIIEAEKVFVEKELGIEYTT